MGPITRKAEMPGQEAQPRGNTTIGGRRGGDAWAMSTPGMVTSERIRARAYEIYQARAASGRAGDATSDWLQAERELKSPPSESATASDVEAKARARGERLLAGDE